MLVKPFKQDLTSHPKFQSATKLIEQQRGKPLYGAALWRLWIQGSLNPNLIPSFSYDEKEFSLYLSASYGIKEIDLYNLIETAVTGWYTLLTPTLKKVFDEAIDRYLSDIVNHDDHYHLVSKSFYLRNTCVIQELHTFPASLTDPLNEAQIVWLMDHHAIPWGLGLVMIEINDECKGHDGRSVFLTNREANELVTRENKERAHA